MAGWILGGLAEPIVANLVLEPANINGELGVLAVIDGDLVSALTFDISDGRIQTLRIQVNPNKLRGLHMGTDTLG